jgi:hypothetical protein
LFVSDIIDAFGVAPSAATRVDSLYKMPSVVFMFGTEEFQNIHVGQEIMWL